MADLFTVTNDGKVVSGRRCSDCELAFNCQLRTNLMAGTGPLNPDFMIVGVSTGVEDDQIGKPFTGKNGRMLRELLNQAGIDDTKCFMTNSLRCASYDTEVKDKHFDACKKHLIRDLKRVKPKAIISLGAKALYWLTGQSGVKQFRRCGIPCLLDPEIFVYPLQQPMAITHAETREEADELKAQMVSDMMWLKKKAEDGTLHTPDDTPIDYKLAETLDDVRSYLSEFPEGSVVCFDLETCTEDWEPALRPNKGCDIALYAFSKGPGHARCIPGYARGISTITWWTPEELEEIKELLKVFFQTRIFFGHNTKFDAGRWVRKILGIMPKVDFDTMYAQYLINENLPRDLESMAVQWAKVTPWKPPRLNQLMLNTTALARYASRDVDATFRIRAAIPYDPRMKRLMEELLLPLTYEFSIMESNGIAVSQENLIRFGSLIDELLVKYTDSVKKMEVVRNFEVTENLGLNVNAPAHIGRIMEDYLKLPKIKTTKGGAYGTDNDVLEQFLDNEFVQGIYFIRKLNKLKSSYFQVIWDRTRNGELIHTDVRVDGTVTGRASSKDPNLFTPVRADTIEKTGITEPAIAKAIFVPRGINRKFLSTDMCLAGYEKVFTNLGLIPIRDIIPGYHKVIQENGALAEVSSKIASGVKDCVKITTESGFSLTATLEHRIRVVNAAGEYVWKRIKEISKEDHIPISPKHLPGQEIEFVGIDRNCLHRNAIWLKTPSLLTVRFAELFGYYVGDGSISSNTGNVSYVVCQQDPEVSDMLRGLMQDFFGKTPHDYWYRGVIDSRISSKPLAKWFESYGYSKKQLPGWLDTAKPECVAGFLRGLFESDGSVHVKLHGGKLPNGQRISVAGKSKELILGVKQCLLRLGMHSSLNYLRKADAWSTSIRAVDVKKFESLIGFLSIRKTKLLKDYAAKIGYGSQKKFGWPNLQGKVINADLHGDAYRLSNNTRARGSRITLDIANRLYPLLNPKNSAQEKELSEILTVFLNGGIRVEKVKTIETVGQRETFDLEVPTTNSFLANGFVSHNSQVELRMMAILSGDEGLIEIYRQGQDLHKATAAKAFGVPLKEVTKGQRSQAKAVNFGIIFGQTEKGLGEQFVSAAIKESKKAGIPFTEADRQKALRTTAEFIAAHKAAFPKVWSYMALQERIAQRTKVLETPTGRQRHFERVGHREARQSTNFAVQSLAADLCYYSLLWTNAAIRELGLDAIFVLSVYDSLIWDVKDEAIFELGSISKSIMEEGLPAAFDNIVLPIVAEVEIGNDLGNMYPMNIASQEVTFLCSAPSRKLEAKPGDTCSAEIKVKWPCILGIERFCETCLTRK